MCCPSQFVYFGVIGRICHDQLFSIEVWHCISSLGKRKPDTLLFFELCAVRLFTLVLLVGYVILLRLFTSHLLCCFLFELCDIKLELNYAYILILYHKFGTIPPIAWLGSP